MNKKLLLVLVASLFFTGINAQNQDPVLMKINNRPVVKSEFEYLYNKNNTASKQSLNEYLKLFTDYKLKVEEAITQGVDTTGSFISEYNNYKNQITQPYLKDTISEQTVAKEIYKRMGENVEVSHILIRLPEGNILPKDTLAAYKKAMSVRDQLFGKKAVKFEDLAKEYSEDPSAKQGERPGYLGWATSMMFVTPFEDAMYATPINEVSMPVRSMFGYHLIKVHDKKADVGKVKVAHIMFGFPQRNSTEHQKDSVKRIANEVYSKITEGAKYQNLCTEYSSDKISAENGGSMGWLRAGMGLPTEFMNAAFAIKDTGEVIKPIETAYGYHILKLEDRGPRDSWYEVKPQILGKISNSDQLEKVNDLTRARLAKEIHYKLDNETYKYLIDLANNNFPSDSVYLESLKANANKHLLSVDAYGVQSSYELNGFADYLASAPGLRSNVSTEFVDKAVNGFTLSKLKEAYANSLAKKYPEYGNLLREYHDGILLFNVMNEEVWEKAAKDTVGLKNYFAQNKAKYTWNAPRYKGYIVYCKDEVTLKEAQKLAKKAKKNEDLNSFLKSKLNNDSVSVVFARKGVWANGDNKFVDYSIYKSEVKPEPSKDYPFYFVTGKSLSAPEDYLDVKGLVIADLQEQKEKEWIIQLREKYPVEIDQTVLETIK